MLHTLVTRREVLRAGAALGALPYLPRLAWPSPQKGGSFAYFSDSHVSLKRNVAECRAMLEEMKGAFVPAFAINGGDVVDYGWKGEYDSYDAVLAGLGWKTRHIPGNHDVRWSPLGLKIFGERVGAPYEAFDAFGVRFVLLDSTVPLSHWGHFESEQLRWLERSLKDLGRDAPVVVATHHWVGRDRVMVDNENALMRVLEPYNVKLILTGHGHNDLLWNWDGALCTMNKGLYQGSYQRVDVDWDAGVLRLSRRTTQRPRLRQIAEVPLRAPREKKPVWRIGKPEVRQGEPVVLAAPGVAEARWNDDAWKPVAGSVAPSEGLAAGTHELSLRANDAGRMTALPVRILAPESRIREVWRARLPGGVMSHLVLDGDRLYVSCMDGSVLALDPQTGRQLWRAKTGGYCHSSPAVGEGLVVVGSANAKVHAFDAASGRPRWTHATGGPVYATAAIARGLAMIGSGDGAVYGLQTSDGKPKWTYRLPAGDTAFTQSVPKSDGERFYFGAWDKYTYALSCQTGELLWRKLCTASTFAFSPAIGGPAMGPEAIYIPANGNELYAFRKSDGEQLWKGASSGDKVGYSAPCLVGGRLFIGCLGDKGEARCFSAQDGKELWTAKVAGVIYDSSPAYGDGLVAVGSVNGVLNLIEAETGAIFDQFRLPTGHFLSSPAMQGRRVFAATYSDEIVCLEAKKP
jgi:outer membrane protein assembly factor BamB